MKKTFFILISILCIAAILCACSKKEQSEPSSETTIEEDIPLDQKIVGTWTFVDAEGNVLPDMKGWVFNEDKTGVDTVFDLAFTYEANNGILTINYDDTTLGVIEATYKYKIKDSLLTMKREAANSESFTYKKDTPNN